MRRGLHPWFSMGLMAVLVAMMVTTVLPAKPAGHEADHNAQVQLDDQFAQQAAPGVECHAGGCPAVQLTIVLSTVFAANGMHATLPPAAFPVPESYYSALDTPPPRV